METYPLAREYMRQNNLKIEMVMFDIGGFKNIGFVGDNIPKEVYKLYYRGEDALKDLQQYLMKKE